MYERYKIFLMFFLLLIAACTSQHQKEKREPRENRSKEMAVLKLEGEVNVTPAAEVLERGRVAMSYSDCFICHKESDKKLGPAFSDIAVRYPMNSGYIYVLSQRIISGTKGMWGNVVMPPHPDISEKDAEAMVMYILSLREAD
mgnify:CR=1 FL=1